MIHATIDLYVKDRKDSEFSDSQTVAEMLIHDLLMSEHHDFLQSDDDLFVNVSVFNNITRNRGSAAYRASADPYRDIDAISKALGGINYE